MSDFDQRHDDELSTDHLAARKPLPEDDRAAPTGGDADDIDAVTLRGDELVASTDADGVPHDPTAPTGRMRF